MSAETDAAAAHALLDELQGFVVTAWLPRTIVHDPGKWKALFRPLIAGKGRAGARCFGGAAQDATQRHGQGDRKNRPRQEPPRPRSHPRGDLARGAGRV